MTTDNLEPVYFAECRKALAAYYTGAGEKGASFLIKNIPGKLYKAGLLYDGIPTADAVDLCTSYAANRSYLIKQGASPDKAGDMALDEMLKPTNETKDKEPMAEPTQHYDPVAAEYELTVFPRPDGALLHKASGLALAPTIQIRSNSPDAMFYLPQLVEMLMENLTELVNTGHYSINYDALSKDFRRNMESQGLPPKQVNDLDNFFGEHPSKAQQGNATPRGNTNQGEIRQPAQTQQANQTPNAYTAEIVAVELITSKDGSKEGYKFYKLHDNQRKPIGGGEFRSNVSEPVLSALGFTVEDITSMNVGDMKGVKNKGVKAEYILEPQPDGKKWTKVTGYIKPDGSRI